MPPRSGPSRLPAGVLAVLALAILFAGFLLGRRSSPVAGTGAGSPTPMPAAGSSTLPAEEPADPAPSAFDVPAATLPAEPPPQTAPALSFPSVPPEAGASAPSAEVVRYFEEADAIEARAKYWSDPQALAKTILEQASTGNTGGFDDLIRAQKGARDELARMTVPAECAEHHRRSLAVMQEGIGLLERVRGALATGDLGGLDGLQESARDLEREAKAIDELGRKLRPR